MPLASDVPPMTKCRSSVRSKLTAANAPPLLSDAYGPLSAGPEKNSVSLPVAASPGLNRVVMSVPAPNPSDTLSRMVTCPAVSKPFNDPRTGGP